MYISPKRKKQYTIAAIVFAVLIPVSVIAVYLYQDWRTGATATAKPEDVRISDLTSSSVVISWVTPDLETEGWVRYEAGSDVNDASPLALDDRDESSGSTERRTTHYVTISNLESQMSYAFVIGSGSKSYKDSEGDPFSFETAAAASSGSVPTPDPVYGSITNGGSQSAIVYVTLAESGEKSSPVSALTNDSGNFEIDLSHVQNSSLSSAFEYDDSTELTFFAQGGDKGGAVLRTSVGESEGVSITMDLDYSITDVFADSSGVDAGDDDDQTPSDDDTDGSEEEPEEEEEEEEEEQGPRDVRDIPLTALILGSSTSETGISNIKVTNVTENSFAVIWESSIKEQGYVNYGVVSDNLMETANDDRDGVSSRSSYYMHHISVKNLIPETTYYYEIHSGTEVYNDDGDPYQITTPATQDSPPGLDSILGEVTGTGAGDSVVVATISNDDGESSEVSAVTDEEGKWVLSIGGIRKQDYSGYYDYSSEDDIEITGYSKGDEESVTYKIGDLEDETVSISLDMIEPEGAGSSESFVRGLYASIEGTLDNLPETAINRIAAAGITVAVLMIVYGIYLLYRSYSSEKRNRWEKTVIDDLDI
ncbi:fibronectin type III domain-containing protein [Candidatus Dojkabacteria bacterium]|nr:fibronectin type III domain-containing protein [Candidatus Dojkabacteria bacterium]